MYLDFFLFFFFFFMQNTAYVMRISDWSSDVCSSDLLGKSGSLIDFQQQIGDPRGRELLIEIEHEILGPFGRVGPQLVDVQLAVLDDAAWDRAGSRRAAKLLQPCIQSSPA